LLGERGTNVGDAGSMDTTQPAQRSSAGPRPIRGQSNNANIKTDSTRKVWQELMVQQKTLLNLQLIQINYLTDIL
jgi:hypothetical protein